MERRLGKTILASWNKESKTIDDVYINMFISFGLIPYEVDFLTAIEYLKKKRYVRFESLHLQSKISLTKSGKNRSEYLKSVKKDLKNTVFTSISTKKFKPKRTLRQLKLSMKRLTNAYSRPKRYLYDKIKEPIAYEEKEDISNLTLLSLKKIVEKIKMRKL